MNDNLKPCPFCGGKAQFARGFDHGEIGAIRWVSCTRCGAMTLSKLYKTEEEAAVVWNTRYEYTCCIFPKPSDSDFVNDWHYLCSECGCEIPVYERNPNDYRVIISHARYCPNCGAKVVE